MTASCDSCDHTAAKAVLLTLVDKEQGYVGLVQAAVKGADPFAVGYVASLLDRIRSGEVCLRHDNEPSLVQLVERVRVIRSPRKTTLSPIVRAEHEMVGAVERAPDDAGAREVHEIGHVRAHRDRCRSRPRAVPLDGQARGLEHDALPAARRPRNDSL